MNAMENLVFKILFFLENEQCIFYIMHAFHK